MECVSISAGISLKSMLARFGQIHQTLPFVEEVYFWLELDCYWVPIPDLNWKWHVIFQVPMEPCKIFNNVPLAALQFSSVLK